MITRFLVFCCVLAYMLSPLEARIGETIRQIELRLGKTGLALSPDWPNDIYQKRLNKHPLKDKLNYLLYNGDLEEHYYFKKYNSNSKDGNDRLRQKEKEISALKSIPGWDYWVYTYKNVSVMEVFVKVGGGITQAEMNQILTYNEGTSSWKEGKEEGFESSLIGYSMFREDGGAYAQRKGTGLILFRKELEGLLSKEMSAGSDVSTDGF